MLDDDDADMAMSDIGTTAATTAVIPSIEDIRRDLLDTITQVLPLVEKRPSGLTWPLAVLGVSLTSASDGDDTGMDVDMDMEADTNSADREFVAKTLYDISLHRDAYYGPVLCRSKLRAFWASGKTGWEDCYDEPCSVLS
ncbi:hypothetical protein NQ176_g11339 [Zarea fungicola]|uniref:Uncharacterized protein n=1 Tax=Zarea fungicola TaxID=93591 RepID=A0ACC1MBL6_9HYPO|nr:hypothetical protein NQ176_g11339 [Lecanicillium fungicola]